MNINIANNLCNYQPKNKYTTNQNPNFEGNLANKIMYNKSITTCEHKVEYTMRVIINKIGDFLSSRTNKELTQNIANIKPEANNNYLIQLGEIGRIYGSKKIIDVNIEDGILEKIAQKNESVIFIMNHSNQSEDPQLLAVLNTLLAEAYKSFNKDNFPLPKIIMNEDILKTMNPTKRKAFENFGAVGIDANIIDSNKGVNARAFLPLIKDFIRNKNNIFIFPEGRLAVRKDLDLHGRFQMGVANMIDKILGIKKSVTVVPVGFAYGKGEQKNLTAMNIGTPINLKRTSSETTISKGDIDKDTKSLLYDFFNKHANETDITMTTNGKPIGLDEIAKYIKTVLCENLKINTDIAKNKLKEPIANSEILIK